METKPISIYRHPKLNGMSYSGMQTHSSCPMKWVLRKLSDVPKVDTIHTIFGKTFGEGIQAVMKGWNRQQVIWRMFEEWTWDIDYEDPKGAKTFFNALRGIDIFRDVWAYAYQDKYELAYIPDPTTGKPMAACELGFKILLPNDYYYIGYVDAVLIDKDTNQLVVLELKTTGMKYVKEESYKNSNQALGYAVVLDAIAKHLSLDRTSYTVLYIVYQTGNQEFIPMPFPKSYRQRARFLKELIMDSMILSFERSQESFKRDGGGCVGFGTVCEFFGLCELDIDRIVDRTKLDQPAPERPVSAMFEFTFDELIEAQKELIS